jgi:hypothetical protein
MPEASVVDEDAALSRLQEVRDGTVSLACCHWVLLQLVLRELMHALLECG